MKRIRQLLMLLSLLYLSSVTSFAQSNDVASMEGWGTQQLPFYSIMYPIDWKIEASEDGHYVAIYPPDYSPENDVFSRNKIEIAYLGYEIPADQSLQAWYDMYYRAAHGNLPPNVNVLDYQSSNQDDSKGVGQRLHTTVVNELGPSQAIKLTHGRLVLSIGTYTHAADMTEVLVRIATSVEFAPDAPRTFSELHNTTQPQPSLQAVFEASTRGGIITQDIVTRDAEMSRNLPSLPPAVNNPEFLESEWLYQKLLESQGLPSIGNSSVRSWKAGGLARILAGVVTSDRKALPSDWWAPISTSGFINTTCGSTFHTGRAAQAIDIGLAEGTQVLAAQAGTIMFAGWYDSGYGYLMRIATDNVNVAGENRKYWHNYAHLKEGSFQKTSGSVTRGEWIVNSGNTGTTTGAHLHFHMTHDVNKNDGTQSPVDLSPLVGFRPNMSYPTGGTTCGQIVTHASDPIIIEPVMFTERYQPRTDHYWFCYTSLNRTTECYMEGVPNNGQGWAPLVTSQSPELRYNNVYVAQSGTYYLWACGQGGSDNDDSLHMGNGGTAPASSQNMSGYHQSAWVWQSVRMDLGRPNFNLSSGQVAINVWMREDGMRLDRLLLTRDVYYSPTNNIRCGGY